MAKGIVATNTKADSADTDTVQREERYQAFIRNSSEGIWRFELEEPILVSLSATEQIARMYDHAYLAEANNALAGMYGFSSTESMIGLRLRDFLIPDDPANTAYLTAFILSGYSLSGVESHEVDKSGNDKFFRNSLVGVVVDGKLLRAWGTQQDVTEQHYATEALAKSEERLALALEASATGVWEWDVARGKLTWSDELKRLFGMVPDDVVTYERYTAMIHPDDIERVGKIVDNALQHGKSYQMEHRIIWPDGSVHWVLGQGRAIKKNGKPIRMIGTSMDIDKRKSAELRAADLTRERTELVALNKAKDDFISLASHQLRTPATGVKQYLGMLLEGYAGDLPAEQRTLLRMAYESNDRQIKIVNDLLKVAHVDSGQVNIKKESINMARLIEDIIQGYAPMFAERNQLIITRYPPIKTMVAVDPEKMRMAIENLIENASKYSPRDKTIRVELAQDDASVTITVIDEGVGIAKHDIPKLFQKFSRISNELSTEVGGSGLGLYWTQKIIDLHGGAITVVSRAGSGSQFTVTLPRRPL